MPALPAVPGVLRVAVKATNSADTDVVWRTFYKYTGSAPTAAQLNTMCASLVTNWGTVWAPYSPTTLTLTQIAVEDLSTGGAVGTAAASTAGTLTGTELPAGVAFLMNLLVTRRYRGGKPRIYLPIGSSAEVNDAQTWKSTFVDNVVSEYGAWQGDVDTAIGVFATAVGQVNVSYYQGFTTFTTPSGRVKNLSKVRTTPVVDTIASYAGNAKFASQRRRNLHST